MNNRAQVATRDQARHISCPFAVIIRGRDDDDVVIRIGFFSRGRDENTVIMGKVGSYEFLALTNWFLVPL